MPDHNPYLDGYNASHEFHTGKIPYKEARAKMKKLRNPSDIELWKEGWYDCCMGRENAH